MMRNHFDEQLSQLNTELITMGALCEEAIALASKYLIENDAALKNLCMRLLLQQQPVARDLRTISSALKMISDMERIGDQASDIAEIVCFVNKTNLAGTVHIADMARATIKMVTESVESFVKNDIEIAYSVIAHDDIVDDLFETVKRDLIAGVKAGSEDAEALIDLLMIAKYFERIGDHAENIAEWVIYSITGKQKDLN